MPNRCRRLPALRLVFSAFGVLLAGRGVRAQDRWARADVQTRRLPPAAFADVPPAVRTDLERRGCTIPQVWYETKPGNILRGHFRSRGQVDWAVLCSVSQVSTILVYWTGRSDSVDELAATPDKQYLQTVGGDSIGFSRAIAVIDAGSIREHYRRYGAPAPPPLDHEGINDAFVEKASVIRYWQQGAWLELAGAD